MIDIANVVGFINNIAAQTTASVSRVNETISRMQQETEEVECGTKVVMCQLNVQLKQSNQAIEALEKPHRKMHDLAFAIYRASVDGKSKEAREMLRELERCSGEVVQQLRRLASDISNTEIELMGMERL
ncbi:hypothetical protein DFP93_13019 [Aneurinibacillus soli]|uniref:Uncharacterized protein n=1 Tax=Aneurinibacillus soli TaxID=1500254 RepID=A0A0U5B5H2_9BACL|nr:hypothetical protein [Aneurinibacillus soli]PYE57502.1 hypothetical protein DFP93_13019 [Aneurinibacillus soli]BAU26109.1 hypothetical protein CB4_00198 [Aneurinibacillus soli]